MLLRLDGYKKPLLQRPGGVWDAYLRMQGVHALYDHVRASPYLTMALRKQPYGDWEFEVRDPNGYAVVFGGDVEVPEPGARTGASAATLP